MMMLPNQARILTICMLLLCSLAHHISADSILRLPRVPALRRHGRTQRLSSSSSSAYDNKQDRSRINRVLKDQTTLLGTTTTAAAPAVGSQPIRRALYFWTRAGPIVVHYKFTQWWLRNSPRTHRDQVYDRLHDTYCQPSLQICLHLQGLFTKIGQVLSARPDFVPHQYVELFATMQDSVPQWPYAEVEALVRDSLKVNQGLEWDDVFESMDETALGSASIGQCHKAILKSPWDTNYKTVAVKIMHPGAETRFRHDFQVFNWLCRIALPGWRPILDELQKQMMTEFDYRQEARNLEEVRANMLASPYKDKVTVPEPLHELCSTNLLVMEMLNGKKFADAIEDRLATAIGSHAAAKEFLRKKQHALVMGNVSEGNPSDASELIAYGKAQLKQEGRTSLLSQLTLGYRLFHLHRHVQRCVELLVDVHGHQIFFNRVFNGDCHPGNMLELTNGKIGLIDYGQTKRLSKEESISIAKVVSELGRESIDDTKVANAMRQCGFKTKFDKDNVLTMYAKLFFDSDDEAKAEGCATPQMYFMKLSTLDPLLDVPDAAIFTARTSYLFRGMGAMAGDQIRTSKYWRKHADKVLELVD